MGRSNDQSRRRLVRKTREGGNKKKKRRLFKKFLHYIIIIEAISEDFSDHLGPAATQESRSFFHNEKEGMPNELCLSHLAPVGVGVKTAVSPSGGFGLKKLSRDSTVRSLGRSAKPEKGRDGAKGTLEERSHFSIQGNLALFVKGPVDAAAEAPSIRPGPILGYTRRLRAMNST